MTKILDREHELTIIALVENALEEGGYDAEQCISGLMVVAQELAALTGNPDQAIDEAVRVLEE